MSDDNQNEVNSKEQEKKAAEDDDTLTEVSDLNEDEHKSKNKKPARKGETEDDKEKKRRQFFQEELKRLQKALQQESSKIKAPPHQEYTPYCFNNLEPYYNTSTAQHVVGKCADPETPRDAEYATRRTAIGLVDPWVSHKMDKELGPKIKSKEPSPFRLPPKKEKKQGEGSTMIPVFPTVNLNTPDLESRQLSYKDVPMLRKELQEKYSSHGEEKINKDYERTKVDFYRMELHRLNDIHPLNRGNMKAAYFAYLQNSPGSKKAVYECVKGIDSQKNDGQSNKSTARSEDQQQQQDVEVAEH